jgi:hypothetical protein
VITRRSFLLGAGALVVAGCSRSRPATELAYYDPQHRGRRLAVTTDVCVYGATAGGVMAAIRAARLGRRTVLLAFGEHVGGLTTSGVSATDIGEMRSVGGLAGEFYRRIGSRYGKPGAVYNFEPRIAADVLASMLRQAGVTVLTNQPLHGVTRRGSDLTALTTQSGTTVRARQFIDASYEGDLMARAGVTYTVGREANSTYNETFNGIRPAPPGQGFRVKVDPYRRPGNMASGLLDGVQGTDPGQPGASDSSVMAYGFRLCITKTSGSQPFVRPAGYDPARYDLVGRTIRAGEWDALAFRVPLPGGKYDLNTTGGVSTDAVGLNAGWAEGDYSTREKIFQDHVRYERGLLWFLGHDPSLPPRVRAEVSRWGLASDEFTSTGGWPLELYVREARRMVSGYVMTEANCVGGWSATDPVALGSYKLDSHSCRRLAVSDAVTNEGTISHNLRRAYGISLRSILPRASECTNLIVSTCLSASHVAWSSLRMEPVFMMLGEAAAVVASLAIDAGTPLQQVPYQGVRQTLLQLGPRLDVPVVSP